jgi:hypothetical protein
MFRLRDFVCVCVCVHAHELALVGFQVTGVSEIMCVFVYAQQKLDVYGLNSMYYFLFP